MYYLVTYIANIYYDKMPIRRAHLDQNVMLNCPVEIEASISLFYQNQIQEKDSIKRYNLNNVLASAHAVVAEAVYGQLICGERLIIDASDSNGTKFFQVTSNGVIIDGEALTITNFESSPIGQQVVLVNSPYNDVTISSQSGIVCNYNMPVGAAPVTEAVVSINGQSGITIDTYQGTTATQVLWINTEEYNGNPAGSLCCQNLVAINANVSGTIIADQLILGGENVLDELGQINGSTAIAPSTIDDSKIISLSADKISAGTIDASISFNGSYFDILNGGIQRGYISTSADVIGFKIAAVPGNYLQIGTELANTAILAEGTINFGLSKPCTFKGSIDLSNMSSITWGNNAPTVTAVFG